VAPEHRQSAADMADDDDQADDEDYLMSLALVLPPELPAGSAFEAYQRRRGRPTLLESRLMMTGRGRSGAGANVHRRMFGYLRRVVRHGAAAGTVHPAPADDEATTLVRPPPSQPPRPRSSSRFRHIMRERLRRERLSQGFADLHALLPPSAPSKVSHKHGFYYRPDRPNRPGPVPVYRSGLAGNRSVPVKFKFEFKFRSSTGSYRYTGRLDRFTGRFDW